MKISELFPRKYASGDDLQGRNITLVIESVQLESMRPAPNAPEVQKPVIYFKGASKGVILNLTLAQQITTILKSDETEAWTGQKITLFPLPLTVAGQKRIAIRAKAPINGESDPPETLQDDD